jgi:hypothetical protein
MYLFTTSLEEIVIFALKIKKWQYKEVAKKSAL